MSKRARRTFTDEFKRQAVELVTKQGYSPAEAARSLDVGEGLLRKWQRALQAEQTPAASALLEDELRRLREENRRLTMEREILKKATAFFAKESP
jgi:transposase